MGRERDAPGVVELRSSGCNRKRAVRHECGDQLLDPAYSFFGNADSVDEQLATRFHLEGDQANQPVGRELTKQGQRDLWVELRRPMDLTPDELGLWTPETHGSQKWIKRHAGGPPRSSLSHARTGHRLRLAPEPLPVRSALG